MTLLKIPTLSDALRIANTRIAAHVMLYATFALIAVVVAAILIVKPRLDRGDNWVGVRVQPDPASGMLVIEEVIPGSPADNVGMLPGDRILCYCGYPVSDANTLKQLIADSYVGQEARFVLDRNGQRLVADTRIAARPADVTIPPPVISIIQGATPPHKPRGACLNCHNIVPPPPGW